MPGIPLLLLLLLQRHWQELSFSLPGWRSTATRQAHNSLHNSDHQRFLSHSPKEELLGIHA